MGESIVVFDWLNRTSAPGRRWLLLGGAPLAVVLGLFLAAGVYDNGRRDLIAPGVKIEGVNVGGLRAATARARLSSALRTAQGNWITVRGGSLRFTLTGAQLHLHVDVDRAIQGAVRSSRGGWFVSRTLRDLFGGRVDTDVPLPVTYDHGALDAFVAHIRSSVDRPAGDASVTVSGTQLVTAHSHAGTEVDVTALRGELIRALSSPTVPHTLSVPIHQLKPKVTTATLAAQYPAYIVVDRPDFKLLLYRHLQLAHTYSIAVGMAGLETPAGLHHILDKQVNPSWFVPHSAWAGSLAGQVIPPGPQDPLVARWMAIDDQGDGIHGTDEPGSIGSAASHGCIRMLVPDVISLYRQTPLGSPVYVI